MILVGITGSIGCGKTTLANIVKDLGYSVFDIDSWVRRIYNNRDFLHDLSIYFPNSVFKGVADKKYLRKVVRIKQEDNILDKMTSYTGDGSFSNSLVAWKDETVTLGEQLPQVFKTADGAKFYAWCMYPYLKEYLTQEIKRDDFDFIFFHEHGIPERQYLTGYPIAEDLDEYYEIYKNKKYNPAKTENE